MYIYHRQYERDCLCEATKLKLSKGGTVTELKYCSEVVRTIRQLFFEQFTVVKIEAAMCFTLILIRPSSLCNCVQRRTK